MLFVINLAGSDSLVTFRPCKKDDKLQKIIKN